MVVRIPRARTAPPVTATAVAVVITIVTVVIPLTLPPPLVIVFYDYVLGETGTHAASPPYPGANTLEGLEAGRGYFVRMTQEAILHLVGLRLPVETGLPLSAGWRWVGYLPEAPRDLPGALDSIAGRYDYLLGEQGTYSPLPPYAGANTLLRMEPGRGYLIRMRQEGLLVYGPGE